MKQESFNKQSWKINEKKYKKLCEKEKIYREF